MDLRFAGKYAEGVAGHAVHLQLVLGHPADRVPLLHDVGASAVSVGAIFTAAPKGNGRVPGFSSSSGGLSRMARGQADPVHLAGKRIAEPPSCGSVRITAPAVVFAVSGTGPSNVYQS